MILYSLWSDYYLDRNENQNQKNPCVLVYYTKYRGTQIFQFIIIVQYIIIYYVYIGIKSLFLPLCWQSCLSVSVPYQARHSIFLTVWQEEK